MSTNVLILAPEDDTHASAVAAALVGEFAANVVRWDTALFPATNALSLTIDGDGSSCVIVANERRLALSDFVSVWWRRPGQFEFATHLQDERVRAFRWQECETFVKGAFSCSPATLVNHPDAERHARKALQLHLAREVGFSVPRTLMSNSPDAVRDFWRSVGGRCVYKAFTAPKWQFAETRPLLNSDLGRLDALSEGPLIVQERVEKNLDIRVTVFDDRVFAGSLATTRPEARLDWRLDIAARWSTFDLPPDVARRCRLFLSRLNLRTGSFDFILTEADEIVFLELNPSGQFLFLEVDTEQPLSTACAEMLAYPRGRGTMRRSANVSVATGPRGNVLARMVPGDQPPGPGD